MYRDSATALDEHDRAVGAILIGEALVASCDRAAACARGDSAASVQERWRAVADAHDAYREIWRHLDRARRVLAARGANTAKYDELRPHAPRAARVEHDQREPAIDATAIDAAKRAIAELKLAVPGADWQGIEERTQGLVRAPLSRRRRNRIALGSVLSLSGLALATWLFAMVPARKIDRAEELRRELADIAQQRRDRIAQLLVDLHDVGASHCDAPRAQELTRLLAQDGRGQLAREFGAAYALHCGDDPVIAMWANAPIQHKRRP